MRELYRKYVELMEFNNMTPLEYDDWMDEKIDRSDMDE